MNKQVCVVIPVYKPLSQLDANEQRSWHQCLRVLGHRPIYLACPTTLDSAAYLAAAHAQGVSCQVTAFAPAAFASIDGYNRLMLSRQFYRRFAQHDYLLLYQLDAYVFEDELNKWCALGYSYVGAPWFEGFLPASEETPLWQVGNGGFTLRRVAHCLRVLQTFAVARSWSLVLENHAPNAAPSLVKRSYLRAKYFLLGNNTHWLLNDFHRYRASYQEDYFWGVVCQEKFDWYRVPTPQEALAFSFEVAPSRMYVLNQQKLPMGCHAWEKHEPEFWTTFIK
ncbi:MAG: hypothetical protein EOO63_08840 [Hymenobacter sp.]|nr:MAG: hypothetical protein EOO63_08840 [Hymenobacter sp.]